METERKELEVDSKVIKEIKTKVEEIHKGNPNLKKIFPIYVEGDEYDGKPYYVGYFKQPGIVAFGKYIALAEKDGAGAMKELAKDCFVSGDEELIKDEGLFLFGLMPQMSNIIEVRKAKMINFSSLGK